ncbi:unnamed protein product [Linum trigynum]|uniref:Uncharacterized protein n=1 Tax=Linum trigynum TaxID=586398 RepID=A0AAV2F9K4_9ROSI
MIMRVSFIGYLGLLQMPQLVMNPSLLMKPSLLAMPLQTRFWWTLPQPLLSQLSTQPFMGLLLELRPPLLPRTALLPPMSLCVLLPHHHLWCLLVTVIAFEVIISTST